MFTIGIIIGIHPAFNIIISLVLGKLMVFNYFKFLLIKKEEKGRKFLIVKGCVLQIIGSLLQGIIFYLPKTDD